MRKSILVLALTCFPLLASAQLHKAWVQTWGGPDSYGLGRGVAVDDSGNVYAAGSTTVNGYFTGVVVKYSAGGRYLWHSMVTGTPHALAADNNGVYVTGTTYSGSIAVMVTHKLRPDGGYGWSDWYTMSKGAGASDIALDTAGNVYVGGWGRAADSAKAYKLVVLKYSNSGLREWAAIDSIGAYIERVALAVDKTGVYVCAPDHGVTYLASYDPEGNRRWFKRHGKFGAYWSGYHGDIALDKEGNVYFTSCVARDTMAEVDLLVGAYTGGGVFLWEDTWICSSSGISTGRAMALDNSTGSIYVTCLYYPDRTENVKRAALIKYTVQGSRPWIRTYVGAATWDSFDDVAADHDGNAYVAGFTDIGGAAGSTNLLMKFDPEGVVKWSGSHTITGGDDVWSAVAVDRAHNVYVNGNITTTWSPYTILLTTAKYSQKGNFRPDRDGWQFANEEQHMWPQTWWSQFDYTAPPYPYYFTWPPINAESADFPNWTLFADAFGFDQCYKKAADGTTIYDPKALLVWRCLVEGNKSRDSTGKVTGHWKGSCAGFTLSALRYFNDCLSLKQTMGDFDTVYSVPIGYESRNIVNKHFIIGRGRGHGYYKVPANQGFAFLKKMLIDDSLNNRAVAIWDLKDGASHSVVACSLASTGGGFWELPIYDPNYPGEYMHLFYHDVLEEWWAEEPGWNGLGVSVRDPIEGYSTTPILPMVAGLEAAPGDASDTLAEFYNSSHGDIRIQNAAGQAIGLVNGLLIDSLPGAYPRLNFGGKGKPPDGYYLPAGEYTVQIGASRDSTTYFAMVLNSAAFSFHRQGAKAIDHESLRFSTDAKSLSIMNPDDVSKAFFLQSIESLSGEATVCRLHVGGMPGGDSLGLQLAGERNVAIVVGSAGMTADLRLELAKDYSNPVFEYAGLALDGGASYLVAPVWDSLASIPLRIYRDRDRDGTVDDTLWLTNQASGVPQGGRGETPERFGLHQNFPNPFNSATTITYELPVSSDVQLAVYDILGRQVRVLVEERKHAGVHRVRFEGGGLASGVYIYRLKAGSFTQSRRLVVLR